MNNLAYQVLFYPLFHDPSLNLTRLFLRKVYSLSLLAFSDFGLFSRRIDRRWKLLPVILLIGIVIVGMAACSADMTSQVNVPAISLNPQTGGARTAVLVSGQNFPPGTTIMLRLGPPDVGATPFSYGSAIADAYGRFSLSFLLPDKWPDDLPITETALTIIAINEDGSLKATAPFAYQPGAVAAKVVPDEGAVLTPDPLLVANEEAVVAAVMSYLIKAGEPTQVAISVEKIEGQFARVSLVAVTPDSAGNSQGFLKLVDSIWQVLVIGRDFEPDQLLELGLPTTILPDEMLTPEG